MKKVKKKTYVFALCILLVASKIYADSPTFNDTSDSRQSNLIPQISVSFFTTTYFGTISELVYFQDHLLSELLWHVNGLTMLGSEFALNWKNGLSVNIQGAFALGMLGSTIEDSDWFNWDPNYTLPPVQTGKTHYSKHTNKLNKGYTADIRLKQAFFLSIENPYSKKRNSFTLSPGLGFRYFYWSFEAWDGYTQYASTHTPDGLVSEWESSWPKEKMEGLGISYGQEIWFPDISVELRFPITTRISSSVSCAYSPFVFCYALDEHHARIPPRTFFDSLSKGIFFEPQWSISYKVSPKLIASLNISGLFIANLRGDTYIYENNLLIGKSILKDGHGGDAGISLGQVHLSCSYLFF